MAYGKIYINNLSKKVTALFNELIDANKLNEKEFGTDTGIREDRGNAISIYGISGRSSGTVRNGCLWCKTNRAGKGNGRRTSRPVH